MLTLPEGLTCVMLKGVPAEGGEAHLMWLSSYPLVRWCVDVTVRSILSPRGEGYTESLLGLVLHNL